MKNWILIGVKCLGIEILLKNIIFNSFYKNKIKLVTQLLYFHDHRNFQVLRYLNPSIIFTLKCVGRFFGSESLQKIYKFRKVANMTCMIHIII